MKKDFTVYGDFEDKCAQVKRSAKSKIDGLRKKIKSIVEQHPEYIRSMKTIAEANENIERLKKQFVEECKQIIGSIFFLDEKYKAENGFGVFEKYPELSLSFYEDFLSKDIDALDFDECVSILKNVDLKNGVIVKNGNSLRLNENTFGDLLQQNQIQLAELAKRERSISFKKKILGFIGPLDRKYAAELAAVDAEKTDRAKIGTLIEMMTDSALRARDVAANMDDHFYGQTYQYYKHNENNRVSYERSLPGLIERIAYETGIPQQIEALRQARDEECCSKETIAELTTDQTALLLLGAYAAEGKTSNAKKLYKALTERQ